jgi:hypothetical protein
MAMESELVWKSLDWDEEVAVDDFHLSLTEQALFVVTKTSHAARGHLCPLPPVCSHDEQRSRRGRAWKRLLRPFNRAPWAQSLEVCYNVDWLGAPSVWPLFNEAGDRLALAASTNRAIKLALWDVHRRAASAQTLVQRTIDEQAELQVSNDLCGHDS